MARELAQAVRKHDGRRGSHLHRRDHAARHDVDVQGHRPTSTQHHERSVVFIITFNFEDGEELSYETDDPAREVAGQIRMRGKSAIKTFSARKA